MNRNMIRIVILGLITVVAFKLWSVHNASYEGLIWADTPSRLLITGHIPARDIETSETVSIDAGDLLVDVNGLQPENAAAAHNMIDDLEGFSPVELRVVQPTRGSVRTVRVDGEDVPAEFVEDLAPSVYVIDIVPDSASAEAGIRKGDIILRINDQKFSTDLMPRPSAIMHFVVGCMLGRPVVIAQQADAQILATRPDDVATFSIMRQGESMQDISVKMVKYHLVRSVRFLATQRSGIWNLDSRAIIPLQAMLALLLLVLSSYLLWRGMISPFMMLVLLLVYAVLVLGIRQPQGDVLLGLISIIFLVFLVSLWILSIRTREQPQIGKPMVSRSAVVASVTVLVTYWLAQCWLDIANTPEELVAYFSPRGLVDKLFDSGPIPLSILWVFIFGLDYLLQVYRKYNRPLSKKQPANAKLLDIIENRPDNELIAHFVRSIIHLIPRENGYYGERLGRIIDRYQVDPDMTAILAIRDEIIVQDEETFALGFVAVIWCERALPILGFLGTVLGIRVAVDGIASSINAIAKGATIQSISGDLNRGFEGIGLAFDTTFFALAAFLLIGLLHTTLKKGLSSQLVYVRQILDRVIQILNPDSVVDQLKSVAREVGKVNSETHLVVGQLKSVTAGTELSAEEIRSLIQVNQQSTEEIRSLVRESRRSARRTQLIVNELQKAARFRQSIRRLTEQVIIEHPNPAFEGIRDILLEPVVEFQRIGDRAAATARQKAIGDRVNSTNWEIRCLGIADSEIYDGFLAVKAGADNMLIPFGLLSDHVEHSIEVPHAFSQLYPAKDLGSLLGVTDERKLFHCLLASDKDGKTRLVKSDEIHPTLGVDDLLFLVRAEERELMVIVRDEVSGCTLDCIWLDTGETATTGRMSEQMHWSQWCAHSPSGTLFALGEPDGGGSLHLRSVSIYQQMKATDSAVDIDDDEDSVGGSLVIDSRASRKLPDGLKPSQLIPLGDNRVLLLDSAGELHMWDLDRLQPRQLKNPAWTSSVSRDCIVRAGTNGWIAVLCTGQLRMWQVRQDRALSQYRSGTSLSARGSSVRDSLMATLDGQYLFAIAGKQTVATWKYPSYVMDELLA